MKIRNLRWWVAALLLVISLKNYADRQILPVLAPTIQAELHIDDHQYAAILNLFFVAYVASYLLSGLLVDMLGSRVSLALFIGVWSTAGALTGFARSALSVGWLRFAFGLGEAGCYTASPKAVTDWFPERERGVAISLYGIGSAIGATIAPLLTIALCSRFGWRATMIGTGLAGLLIIIPWLIFFRNPKKHPWLTDEERKGLQAGNEDHSPTLGGSATLSAGVRWKAILTSPAIWALMLSRMLTDPVWYFFQFWMPKYFNASRGLSQKELSIMWVIFLAAGIGFMAGGWLSDSLVRRGQPAPSARLWIMLGAAALVPLATLVPLMPGVGSVLGVSSIVVLAQSAWLTNHNAYAMNIVPKPIFGTAYGLISAGSACGGLLMNQVVAWTIGHFSYDYCFYAVAFLHPVALLIIWKFSRRPFASFPTASVV